jgi:hypothetical protein
MTSIEARGKEVALLMTTAGRLSITIDGRTTETQPTETQPAECLSMTIDGRTREDLWGESELNQNLSQLNPDLSQLNPEPVTT